MTTLEVTRIGRKASLMRYLPAFRKAAGLVLLAALAFTFVVPILWMTVMSFQEGGKMFNLRTEWIPAVWHFENYPNAISRAPFVQYFINSGIVSLTVMAGNVVFCTLAGYGLAKFRFPGSGIVLLLILSTLMVRLYRGSANRRRRRATHSAPDHRAAMSAGALSARDLLVPR